MRSPRVGSIEVPESPTPDVDHPAARQPSWPDADRSRAQADGTAKRTSVESWGFTTRASALVESLLYDPTNVGCSEGLAEVWHVSAIQKYSGL